MFPYCCNMLRQIGFYWPSRCITRHSVSWKLRSVDTLSLRINWFTCSRWSAWRNVMMMLLMIWVRVTSKGVRLVLKGTGMSLTPVFRLISFALIIQEGNSSYFLLVTYHFLTHFLMFRVLQSISKPSWILVWPSLLLLMT